jgi:hypothetical protein
MISSKPQGRRPRVHRIRGIALAIGGLCVACCFYVGCGGSKKEQWPTAEVTGRVTYRGKPLDCGTVKFLPTQAADEGVRVAYGIIDEQGCYRLGTYGQTDGAILGDFQVVVACRPAERSHNPRMQRAASQIPARYADPVESGLTAHVAAGSNTFDFDLKDER